MTRIVVLLIFLGLVLVPLWFYGFDSEAAKWQAARAQLQYNRGETQAAIATMEEALQQSPRDHWLKLTMTQFLLDDGQATRALQLIEEVLDHDPESTTALRLKSNCLMYLGRAEEALEVVKDHYAQLRDYDEATRLNHLAYFRALAGKEIDTANSDIEDVIRQVSIYSWPENPPMSLQDQTLLAAAILSRRLGQQQQVLQLLNQRIDFFESSIPMYSRLMFGSVYDRLLTDLPLSSKFENNVKRNVQIIQAEKSFLAYFYAVRALIHQDAGNQKSRDADRLAIQELGFDEGDLIETLPDDWQLLILLSRGSQLLDTRAMVHLARRREMIRAKHDLDVAVLGFDLISRSFDGQIQNTIRNENGRAFGVGEVKRSQAVVLKHRSDLHRTMGRAAASDRDLQRITELGFSNPDTLF